MWAPERRPLPWLINISSSDRYCEESHGLARIVTQYRARRITPGNTEYRSWRTYQQAESQSIRLVAAQGRALAGMLTFGSASNLQTDGAFS